MSLQTRYLRITDHLSISSCHSKYGRFSKAVAIVIGLFTYNATWAQENYLKAPAAEYLKHTAKISDMRMLIGPGFFEPGFFESPIQIVDKIDPSKALRILKLLGEAKPSVWPTDIDDWQEEVVITIAYADNRILRISVFTRQQIRTPFLVVVGLRCFMINDRDLIVDICEAANLSQEPVPLLSPEFFLRKQKEIREFELENERKKIKENQK
jgi:hypothetical protein